MVTHLSSKFNFLNINLKVSYMRQLKSLNFELARVKSKRRKRIGSVSPFLDNVVIINLNFKPQM